MNYRIGQIVQAQVSTIRLYAEVRSISPNLTGEILCWVRPLVLTFSNNRASQDVRGGFDVIWPITWFSPAFDADVLELLPWLDWEQVVCYGPNPEHISWIKEFSALFYRAIHNKETA